MEPMPDKGRVFEQSHLVGPAEVGADGRAHLHAIADWLQNVAFADGLDSGLTEGETWLVRRTKIRIERCPTVGENLRLRTACSGYAATLAERRTSLVGDQGAAVEAEAIWVLIDPATRMPARLDERFIAVYGASADGRRARSKLRHPAPPEGATRTDWSFRDADIDLAGHVNNTVYWQIAEQHLPNTDEPIEIEVEYRAGAVAGPATVLRDPATEGMLWVLDGAGELSASIRGARSDGSES